MLLRKGDVGDLVKRLQRELTAAGYPCAPDGVFGPLTHTALVAYQGSNGLVPDGLCGPATWACLSRPPAAAEGLDVSGWQDALDWRAVRQSGLEFVFVKATEGAYHVSPGLNRHWERAGDAGLLRGAYHFARLDFEAAEYPEAQADHFMGTMDGRIIELPLVLDLELGGIPRHLPAATVVDWAETFLQRIHSETGVRPLIYTGYWTWRRLDCAADLFRWPLWQADYDAPDPIPGWDPAIIQHTCRGRVPGYNGYVDLNRSFVPLSELQVTWS